MCQWQLRVEPKARGNWVRHFATLCRFSRYQADKIMFDEYEILFLNLFAINVSDLCTWTKKENYVEHKYSKGNIVPAWQWTADRCEFGGTQRLKMNTFRNLPRELQSKRRNELVTKETLYAINLRNFVVPTRSVRYVILFLEAGVVHWITYSFNYFFLLVVLFSQFIVDEMKKKACCTKLNN